LSEHKRAINILDMLAYPDAGLGVGRMLPSVIGGLPWLLWSENPPWASPALLAFKIYPDFERAARADPDHL